MIFYIFKPLLRVACAGVFLLATVAGARAQQLSPSQVGGNAEPLPDNSQSADTSQNADNSQNNTNSQNNDNSQNNPNSPNNPSQTNPSASRIPNPQNPNGSTSTYTPLIPQSSASPYTSLNSGVSNQSTLSPTPVLYNTGTYDLSQIATSNALSSAFSGQSTALGFSSDQGMSFSHPPIERIRLGPFDLKAAATSSVVEDDNINAGLGSGTGKENDTIFTLTPAVLLEYGNHEGQRGYASLVYAPTLTRYYHHSALDTDNQNVSFAATYPLQRLTLDVSDTFSQVTGVNQDTFSRTTQTSNDARFGANYAVDDKLGVYTQYENVETSYANGGGNSDEFNSISSTVSYQLSDKITLGPEVKLGIEKPENSDEQTFEQALVTMTYRITEKIGLSGSGGAEFRQQGNSNNSGGDNGGDGTSTSPVFNVGLGYSPFDSTQMGIFAYENIQASSGDSSQNVTNTGVGFSLNQRIKQRFFFGFTFFYSHSEYSNESGAAAPSGAAAQTPAGNQQDNFVYRPSLSFSPTVWSSIALYYQYQDNEANGTSVGYHDNQMGVSISAQF